MKTTQDQTKQFLANKLSVRAVGTWMTQPRIYITTLFTLAALLFVGVGVTWARPMFAVAPTLGTAGSFAVLAGSTATNTGPTNLTGDLGVSPGTAITGFPPGVVTDGTTHANDATAMQAQNDVTTAYNNLAGQACDVDMTSQDLGGLTLTPGVYCFPNTTAQLTGEVTLDGQGDSSAIFVFQIGSTLTTASNASVLTLNGATACNVFWQVGSSATLGTGTEFAGNILALQSISLNTNANLLGRALARNGAVTMDSNDISTICTVASPTNTPVPGSTSTPVANVTQPPAANTSTPVATDSQPPVGSTPTPVATDSQPPAGSTPTPVATDSQPPAGSTPTPVATDSQPPAGSTPTATSTGEPPAGADSTPEAPTALDPGEQPKESTVTLFLPLGMK